VITPTACAQRQGQVAEGVGDPVGARRVAQPGLVGEVGGRLGAGVRADRDGRGQGGERLVGAGEQDLAGGAGRQPARDQVGVLGVVDDEQPRHAQAAEVVPGPGRGLGGVLPVDAQVRPVREQPQTGQQGDLGLPGHPRHHRGTGRVGDRGAGVGGGQRRLADTAAAGAHGGPSAPVEQARQFGQFSAVDEPGRLAGDLTDDHRGRGHDRGPGRARDRVHVLVDGIDVARGDGAAVSADGPPGGSGNARRWRVPGQRGSAPPGDAV
jgi:hypothetical protein